MYLHIYTYVNIQVDVVENFSPVWNMFIEELQQSFF